MRTINLSSYDAALVAYDKPTWALFSNLIQPKVMEVLVNSYPQEGYVRALRDSGSKKHYAFQFLKWVEHNRFVAAEGTLANQLWYDLADDLMSKDYIESLSQLLKIDLSEALINIGFYKFDSSDWVSPHIDNEDKLVTQIFYFNSAWSSNWGGYFQILEDNNADSALFSVPPLSSFSVAIPRSEKAWHMVNPVTENTLSPRFSMQLEFIRA